MARIIVALMIFAAAAGVFFGLTIPALNSVKTDSANNAKILAAVQQFQDLEKKRNELVAKYGSVSSDDVKRLETALPEQVSAVKLVAQIDDMSRQYGLVLKKIDIEDSNTSKNELNKSGDVKKYKTASITFSVSGSYNVFLNFLSDLEKSLQVIDVKEINFAVGTKADSYDFSVRATTYYAGNQ